MKRKWFRSLLILGLLFTMPSYLFAQAAPSTPPPTLTTLQPGGFRTLQQNLEINVVLVGFDPVDTAAFESQLPQTYRTILRYPAFYGIQQFLGNDFTFDYNFVDASSTFENAFFTWLGGQGTVGSRTVFQEDYNNQQFNVLDVGNNVRYIDAPSVEQYLLTQGNSMLGDYTVFFINWYSRPDFQFHLYTKTDAVDPDTGYNFGLNRQSRKIVAWGGTHGRAWFYDFSAGPEAWANNYVIDPPGVGYTIPPIWEYGNPNAYRPFNDLVGDMARLTRFVGINLLFTPSPLYKPLLSPPQLPETVNIDLNLLNGDPSSSALDWIDPAYVAAQYSALQPYKSYSADVSDSALTSKHNQVFNCFAAGLNSCYGKRLFNISFGDLFLYAEDHLFQYLDGGADYEIPIFVYNVPDAKLGVNFGLLGFADDNWRDGTQSFIFEFSTPTYRALGYGMSTTAVHEAGHHVGFSHPHDGYDYELNLDYGPDGDLQFAWSGDESDTVMSYTDLSQGFGKFNQDSMYRYETAGYLNEANAILADIYANPNAGAASSFLVSADQSAALALAAYDAMDYLSAVTSAKAAYDQVLLAAALLKVPVEPQAWQADYKARGQNLFVDPIRYPDR